MVQPSFLKLPKCDIMKKMTILIIFIALVQIINAQTKDSSIKELLNLSGYTKDTDAGALIIYDLGSSDIVDSDQGFFCRYNRKCRVKFFNDSELGFAEINIPLYEGERQCENITQFKAIAYNMENGIITTTQTDKKGLLEETYSKNWKNYKIPVAGVKTGTVMDFEYTIESPYLFNLHGWQFQNKIPVLYSEFIAKMVPFYSYSYIIKGTTQLDELNSNVETGLSYDFHGINYQKTVYKFVKSNIPAFYADSYITSENDYMISLDFQLSEINHIEGYKEKIMTTWPELNKELLDNENFGGFLNKSKKLAEKMLAGNSFIHTNNIQYAEQLVNYVKNNFEWNNNKGYMSDCKPNDFLKNKKGNASALNLYLAGLLRAAGFSADPVILSTRDNGKIYIKYPFLHYFNFAIVLANIDGKEYLFDATNKYGFYNQISTRCINEVGLVVKNKEEKWVMLNSSDLSVETNTFYYQFNSNADSLLCSYNCKTNGYFAQIDKSDFKNNPSEFIQKEVSSLFDETNSSNIYEKDSIRMFNFSGKGMIRPTNIDKFVSVKPFLNKVYTENPFSRRERNYPVDFTFTRKRSFSAQVILPKGAKLVKIPESYNMDNINFSLNYQVTQVENGININADYSLKKTVYNPSLYPGLRDMYENLIKYFNQNIEIQLP
jgi:hypothetical protein